MGVSIPRLVGGRHEPQISTYGATLLETVGIFQGQHEAERRERSDPLDLPQELGLRVVLFGDRLQLALIVADTLRK